MTAKQEVLPCDRPHTRGSVTDHSTLSQTREICHRPQTLSQTRDLVTDHIPCHGPHTLSRTTDPVTDHIPCHRPQTLSQTTDPVTDHRPCHRSQTQSQTIDPVTDHSTFNTHCCEKFTSQWAGVCTVYYVHTRCVVCTLITRCLCL